MQFCKTPGKRTPILCFPMTEWKKGIPQPAISIFKSNSEYFFQRLDCKLTVRHFIIKRCLRISDMVPAAKLHMAVIAARVSFVVLALWPPAIHGVDTLVGKGIYRISQPWIWVLTKWLFSWYQSGDQWCGDSITHLHLNMTHVSRNA